MTPVLAVLALSLSQAAGADLEAARAPVTLALVVASNRGARPGRPSLQYADDDGARYFHVLSAIAGAEGVVLLTELDRDSARLFPELVGKVGAPTRAGVAAAGEALARRAARLRGGGRKVRFYFVFAGHGDVEDGKGFIELADGAFTADDLQSLVAGVAASESHVILDSCNSYFVVNPRKPGGRSVPTPQDAAERLARRLPRVGVFLSTAAQANVYEWSELQSGVFSHAVRSGLLGAADADGDGRVSYLELAAFVETAAAEIKNPLYRPRLFARGPDGDATRTILERPRAAGAALLVDERGPVRLAVRDADGLRWLDAYKEAEASVRLWFPAGHGGALEVERLATGGAGGPEPAASYRLPAPGPAGSGTVLLAQLEPASPQVAGRGVGEIFRSLFTRPFGPQALAAFLADGGLERVGECPPEAPEPGFLERLSVGVAAGVAFPRLHPEGEPELSLGTAGDLALRVALQLGGPASLQLELGYVRASASEPWRSAAYWDAVLGPGYLGPREPPPADVEVELVPVLAGVRLAQRVRWGLVPHLTLSGGAVRASFEVRPTGLYTGIVSGTEDWAGAVQGGVGIALDMPRGFTVALEAQALRLLSPVQAYGIDFEVSAFRAGLVLGWGSASALHRR
jgi:hypothetical protein